MARATWVVNELKHMKGKYRMGIKLLSSLFGIAEVRTSSGNSWSTQGVTFKEPERQLGVSMPLNLVYMTNVVPSIPDQPKTIKVNKVSLGFSFTPFVTFRARGFSKIGSGGFSSGSGFGSEGGVGGSSFSGDHGGGFGSSFGRSHTGGSSGSGPSWGSRGGGSSAQPIFQPFF